MEIKSPELYKKITEIFEDVEIEKISHSNFKRKQADQKQLFARESSTPFANVILQSGVVF